MKSNSSFLILISGLLTIVIVLLIKEKNEKFTEYIHVHKQNVEYCPATYKLVEKMKLSVQ
jgi:hypothetical protein